MLSPAPIARAKSASGKDLTFGTCMADGGSEKKMTDVRSVEKEDGTAVLADVCAADQVGEAVAILRSRFPFIPLPRVGRPLSLRQRIAVFARDGFVDRYSGKRLVFPGTMRLLTKLMPDEFPYHPNWKVDVCHFSFYELYPVVDHIFPLSRGGADVDTNMVSTCTLLNAAKSHSTLEELGWTLHPPGRLDEWDGLTRWFLSQAGRHPTVLDTAWLRQCNAAAQAMLGTKR
jgi:5-methylcytosine-specific restriction endonuclease McrA